MKEVLWSILLLILYVIKPEYVISSEICSYYVGYGEQSGVMNFNSKATQTDNLWGLFHAWIFIY